MCAIYAFMRYCDDLSDDEGIADRAAAIARWRGDLEAALAGRAGDHAVWPAFIDAVARYKIPHQYFYDMIEGVSSDLEPRRMQTFDELYDYCYHVASVVGLTIIHIFGFESPKALELAEKVRDRFPAHQHPARRARGRREKSRLSAGRRFRALRRFAGDLRAARTFLRADGVRRRTRARNYYRQSAPLIGLVHTGSRASLRALIGIYSRLLDRIVASNYDVLARRVRVPTWEKLWVLVRSAV